VINQLIDRHPRFANWLYGFTPPEVGTIVLVHRRVYIVPTQLGWLFALTLLILLVGSINYALSLGFALTFLLAGMGLAAMAHTARNLARMAISVGRVEPVFVGEHAQFRLYLDSRAAFDRPAILARQVATRAQLVVDVPAGGLAQVILPVQAASRGWLPIGRVMLETRFPLGIFRAWSYVEPNLRCLVYPKPERSPLPVASAEAARGSMRSPVPGNDDYSGLRAYQLSDSPRHVAWKAVARSEDMLTKQFTGEAAAELLLDWNRLPPTMGVEQRLSRLAGWVLAAERAGINYGVRLPGNEIATARGEAHQNACLQALALYGVS